MHRLWCLCWCLPSWGNSSGIIGSTHTQKKAASEKAAFFWWKGKFNIAALSAGPTKWVGLGFPTLTACRHSFSGGTSFARAGRPELHNRITFHPYHKFRKLNVNTTWTLAMFHLECFVVDIQHIDKMLSLVAPTPRVRCHKSVMTKMKLTIVDIIRIWLFKLIYIDL